MLRLITYLVLACFSTIALAADYPANLFVVAQLRIDVVREPHGMDSLLSTRDSRQIRSSVSRFMGVQSAYVALSSAAPTARVEGEETFYNLPLPAGYVSCAARLNVVSLVPADGPRASVLHSTFGRESAGAYTWTPRRQPWEGRSWIEAELQLLGIKAEHLDDFRGKGVCGTVGNDARDLARCRGNPCPASTFGRLDSAGTSTKEIRALPTIAWDAKAIDVASFTVAPSPLQFAAPPTPNVDALRACRNTSGSEQAFFGCLAEQALPEQYKLTRACVDSNRSDAARAAICSTGRADLLQYYDRAATIQRCARNAKDDGEVALCAGSQFLGAREMHYARCLNNNRTDVVQAAVCGLAQDLTPEQQIAVSCAMKTGLAPKAFAVCTGGRLFEREVNKCWDNGIGTENGCFGPNNEIRKFWNLNDDVIKSALGESNDIYRTFKIYKDNVLMPGPTHDFIKAVNVAQRDLKHGPGPNNDLVKASNAIGGAVQSVGETIGGLLGF